MKRNRPRTPLGWAEFFALVVAFCLSVPSNPAAAQTGSVRGKVLDEAGEPLADAEVVIEFLGGVTRTRSGKTNRRGEFVLVGLPTGPYRITYHKEGYQSVYQDVTVPGGQATVAEPAVLPRLEAVGPSPELREIFSQGVESARAGDFEAAARAFEHYLESDPESPEAHFNAAMAYERLNQAESAIAFYTKAAELKPDYFEAYLALGDLYGGKREWDKASESFETALKIRPDEILPRYNYGVVSMNLGNMETAAESFEKVLALEPSHAAAHYQLGMVLLNRGKMEEAIPHFQRYLELEPEGTHAATARGILDQLQKN